MFKTHEKSRFEVLSGNVMDKEERIVVQIADEMLYTNVGGMACFLCETVSPEDYNQTTAEGRAAEAEKKLADEIDAHKIEMEEAQETLEVLQNQLAESQDCREGLRRSVEKLQAKNMELYKALAECRRIFGDLPPEIEELFTIPKGEMENVHTGTVQKYHKAFIR